MTLSSSDLQRAAASAGFQTEPVGDAIVTFGRVCGDRCRGNNNLGTKRCQQINFVPAHLVRHYEDASVLLNSGNQGYSVFYTPARIKTVDFNVNC